MAQIDWGTVATFALAGINILWLASKWVTGQESDSAQNTRRLEVIDKEIERIDRELKYRADHAHGIADAVNAMPHRIGKEIAVDYVSKEVFDFARKESERDRTDLKAEIAALWKVVRARRETA